MHYALASIRAIPRKEHCHALFALFSWGHSGVLESKEQNKQLPNSN
jgi:hypothetical protein